MRKASIRSNGDIKQMLWRYIKPCDTKSFWKYRMYVRCTSSTEDYLGELDFTKRSDSAQNQSAAFNSGKKLKIIYQLGCQAPEDRTR